MEHHLFSRIAPGGESYPQIAERLHQWISEQDFAQDMLIISHGMTARVLRGILRELEPLADYGAPIAPSLSQGSMVMICDGEEELIVSGDGSGEKA
jgi:probable phosphoglycerate mutase